MMTRWGDESARVPIWRRYFIDIISASKTKKNSPYTLKDRDLSEKARARGSENEREREREKMRVR